MAHNPRSRDLDFFLCLAVDAKKAHDCVLVSVVLIVVVILFPFHWGGEDWNENDSSTRV